MAAFVATILEMREQRAALVTEARDIHNKSVEEKREMTGDEEARYNTITGDMDKLKVKIDREERLLNEERELEQREGRKTGGKDEKRSDDEKDAEYRALYTKFLKDGVESLSPEERSTIQEKRAMNTGTTGVAGGYTIPTGFYADLIQAMKTFGGMRQVSRVMPTATGNQLLIPTVNNTAQVGKILGESTAAVSADPASFGQTALGAFKYTSDIILIPIELIQDSAFDMEGYARGVIADRIARITNTHFTVGTGSGQPLGIVPSASLGKTGANGQTTSIIADDFIDMEHSIDPVYRAKAKWMLHDSSLKAVKKLKDGQGRFLWLPGLAVNEPDTILNYGYQINQDMPVMGVSAKSLLFGDLGSYWIRDVMDVSIVRFAEKYMDAGQVGFVAFSRHDGKFINAGGNQIVYYANSAT